MIKIKVNGALFDLTEETLSYIRERYGEKFNYELDPTEAKRALSSQTDRYFYSQAKARGGYLNMGEIVHDAGEGDPDAQFLLKLYDAIWEKEEELENQIDSMSLEELLNLNIEAWVKPLYDQIVAELENTADSTTDTTSNTSEG